MDKTKLAALLALSLGLAACVTDRQTDPAQTATEQLLVARAAERSVARIELPLAAGSKVFLDTQYFDTDTVVRPKYTVSLVRDQLLRQGLSLVDDRNSADTVIELRSAAQSIDYSNFLVGIPSFPVPVPLAGTLQFPEIALFKIDKQKGVSDLALTAYGRDSGRLISSTGSEVGTSLKSHMVVLLVSWTRDDVSPPADTKQDSGDPHGQAPFQPPQPAPAATPVPPQQP